MLVSQIVVPSENAIYLVFIWEKNAPFLDSFSLDGFIWDQIMDSCYTRK